MIQGIAAAAGVAIGKAFVLPTWEWDVPDQKLDTVDLTQEFERLYEGIRTSKHEIESMKNEFEEIAGPEESSIFDAHIAILEDPEFMNEIRGLIERQYKAAEVAVQEATDHFVTMFDLLDDEYMKERAADIKDVGNRLLKHLLGAPEVTLPTDTQPYILVAKELPPSQLVHLNPQHVLGIVTMMGGKTSHSAIMARALGIPLVSGLENELESLIQTGEMVVVDGDQGRVYVEPDAQTVESYQRLRTEQQQRKRQLALLTSVEPVTADGVKMRLSANISSIKELDIALNHGAEGVGLFRTEFMYMDRKSLPEEQEQFEIYRMVAEKSKGQPVVIRTLDIGGDKELDYFELPEEENPFLGYRAIRICLDHPEMFRTQLRAILRASAYGKVKIMYPMISSLEELRRANEALKQAKQELDQREIHYDSDIEVGIMIEVPAAVAIADLLAEECDFFSIGSNDLVQYVLAVDRMNEHIAHMYNPYHPAVLRMLRTTVEAARASGIPVSICGEMAGDERSLPFWMHLGVRQLSMSPQSLLRIKQSILHTSSTEAAHQAAHWMKLKTAAEIEQGMSSYNRALHELIAADEQLACSPIS
ncbi:phosphoenolpyruvate--protein phosphotransferase [Paenibacillus bovis]|uniref:Phosphoenolpyruvate-protein phosphotransferase n=1 Tax=Paenibacillus bovis TaxID=1616788 RepID=A0A172ZKH5_9BACL|nr:phosphoenolpyruvate--protein phosphotransferase [Paenibacillus bovis]ANF97640.1 phosphoenolpyruvate--protein phosphotransferase [Paenibacillus bovis]